MRVAFREGLGIKVAGQGVVHNLYYFNVETENHEEAIGEVILTLEESNIPYKKPVLAVIQGGKK